MSIPTYTQWLSDTGGSSIFKPRNAQLTAVDEAIRRYEKSGGEKDLWQIKHSFEDWKRAQGALWETCERNRSKALTRLNFDLMKVADCRAYQISRFSMQELMALAYMARERRRVLAKVFAGKEVTLKMARLKDADYSGGR